MLFDFVRAAFASPRRACTDLNRRLRDGVSLSFWKAGWPFWNGNSWDPDIPILKEAKAEYAELK